LQYANWLDGCGNPMGEFIRLQCLLARQPVGVAGRIGLAFLSMA
jgi:hypothetical protein